jgi:hypothetical protein
MADNYIKDTLKDVLKHTHSLGIFEMVKISGTMDETVVETVDAEKTVIFKGKMTKPVPDFADNTVGLSRMSVLDGYLKFPGFDDDAATVRVTTQERNGQTVPTEVEFVAEDGTNANYRFMLAEVINQQLKEIKYKGADFDVNIVPTQKNLKDLAYFNSVLGQFESTFSPRTEDGKLYFYIGDGGGDRTKILVNDSSEGDITHEFHWPLDIVLKILRLSESSNVVMSFNAKGLMQIVVHSGLSEYTYLLPAKG